MRLIFVLRDKLVFICYEALEGRKLKIYQKLIKQLKSKANFSFPRTDLVDCDAVQTVQTMPTAKLTPLVAQSFAMYYIARCFDDLLVFGVPDSRA